MTIKAGSPDAIVKRIFLSVILLVLVGPAMSALALGDPIRFSQDGSGALSAVLAGSVDPCAGSHQLPWGESTVSRIGNEYDINTFFLILDPPPCPHNPEPYAVTASLGNAADGHYTVVWTAGVLIVRGTFDVRSGILQSTTNDVPALTPSAQLFLVTMIALAGLALLRRRR